jgi:hypothetical protein
MRFLLMATAFLMLFTNCKRDKPVSQAQPDKYIDGLKAKYNIGNLDSFGPDMGQRLSISGDFDGDGTIDTLTEFFCSGLTDKETCKYYDSIEYYDHWFINDMKQTYCFIAAKNKLVDTIWISDEYPDFGLFTLRNEGDLDGNGTDEITIGRDPCDASSLNHVDLLTYTKTGWQVMYYIPVWEWQVQQNDVFENEDDTTHNPFNSFIRKKEKGLFEVAYRDEEASVSKQMVRMDTLVLRPR